jgi:hypothetical protein
MTASSNDSAKREADEAAARKVKERVLVFIVAFLGLLIVGGIAAVVLRIIYLSSTPAAQRAAPATGGNSAAAVKFGHDRLDLPAGAIVKSISVNGDRLAVHFEAPSQTGIAVVDLATGAVVRRVDVVPAAAQR